MSYAKDKLFDCYGHLENIKSKLNDSIQYHQDAICEYDEDINDLIEWGEMKESAGSISSLVYCLTLIEEFKKDLEN